MFYRLIDDLECEGTEKRLGIQCDLDDGSTDDDGDKGCWRRKMLTSYSAGEVLMCTKKCWLTFP